MTNIIKIETLDFLIPTDNIIKIVKTKTGERYYIGSSNGFRFFPLSKKNFEKMNKEKMEVYKEVGQLFVKVA